MENDPAVSPSSRGSAEKMTGTGSPEGPGRFKTGLKGSSADLNRFCALFDGCHDLILLVELGSGRMVEANLSACRRLGYAEEELRLLKFDEVVNLEQLQWPCQDHPESASGEIIASLRTKDGKQIPVEMTLGMDGSGHATYAVAVIRDISVRLQAESSLRLSEMHFRSVFETAAAGMVVLTDDGRFLKTNQAFDSFIGYSRDELLQMRVTDITHPADRAVTMSKHLGILQGKWPVANYQKRYLRKDGQIVWGHASVACVIGGPGEQTYCVGMVQDITPQKLALDNLKGALRETEAARQETDAILKSVLDGLVVTDPEGRISLMNKAAEALWNQSAQQSAGLHLDAMLQPLVCDAAGLFSRLCASDGKPVEMELLPGSNVAARFVQARASLIRDRKGADTGVVILFRDVTRERELDQMKTDFISTAAHELRTPLTSILGFSQVLLDGTHISDAERREFTQYIVERSQALSGTVTELLDIARIESGQGVTLNLWPVAVKELVVQMRSLFKEHAASHRFEQVLEHDQGLLLVDRSKVAQVFENLLSNAIKYSPEGGIMLILGQVENENYRFSIIDEGIGMTLEQQTRIFDKFYRADASNTAVGGVGLGMSIVKYIIEAHGGKIWVNSEPGKGTTVHFTLPLAPGTVDGEGNEENTDCR